MAEDTDTDTLTRWEPRPGVAALVRGFVLVAPILASVVFVHVASQIVGPPSGSALRLAAWWIGLGASATVVLVSMDRLTRRLLPLSALLKLALVFPDEAPSRFRTALSAGTTAELEGRLQQAREGAETDTPVDAAERLLGFVAALNTHDRVTRGHSERVRAYAQMIAKELHLSRDEVDRLNWAALLHDIGKLEVPADVLNKPGRLTDEEWQLIRRHPELGDQLVAPLRAWLGPWTDAISDHHERWNGTGYPLGTEGESISLAGRIVAVADVFDVITSARSYKASGNAITAREEIARCAGDQFDPRVVRAFLSISLGRLRFAMGPLSWLAQAPMLGRIPLTPGLATVASSAVAVVGSLAAGLVAGSHVPSQFATPAHAAATTPAAYIVQGGKHLRIARPGRRGGAALVRPLALEPVGPALTAAAVESAPPPGDPAPVAPDEPPAVPVDLPPGTPRPSFAPGADETVREDAGPQRVAGWARSISGSGVTFTLSDDNGALFGAGGEPALDAQGTLTYAPAADASGTAHVTIHALAKDGKKSPATTLTISVIPVNDAPGFAAGADQTAAEDSGPRAVAGWAHAIAPGPADEVGQAVAFAASTDNPSLFAGGGQPAVGADGTLRYAPAANAAGHAVVSVRAVDDGGTANDGTDTSPARTFAIDVTAVNDAPRFVAGSDQAVLEDSGPQIVSTWATAIAPGPADEGAQKVSFAVSSGAPSLFAGGGQPAIAADGSLTFTPAADASGLAVVTVRAVDDGGSAAGGNDTSAPQTFLIAVAAVNDAPTFAGGADQAVFENAAPQTVAAWATGMSAGPADESGQGVTFAVSSSDPALFSGGGQPAVNGAGALTFTPATGAHGAATVSVRAVDDGGTAGGGADTSAAQTFVITVVNQAPVASADAPSVPENDVAGVTFNVLTNDSDPEGDPLSLASYDDSTIANGGLTSNGGGSFTYVPAPHFAGTDTFSYTASDGNGNTAAALVTITVTAVPDPPAAADDSYVTPQDVALVQVAPGVLANDSDSAGGTLLVDTTPVVAPANGSLSLAADGSFTYTPTLGFTGSDTFTYRVTSGASGLGATGVVTITVSTTFSSSLLYLTPSGPTSDLWDMSTSPPVGSPLLVPDYDGDLAQGLTIKSSDGKNTITDPHKAQTWRWPLASPLVLAGPVTLHLSSYGSGGGTAFVYLFDCTALGACTQISSGTLSDNTWNGSLSWGQHDISVGTVNRTLPAGHELRVRLLVGHGDQWVAMTATLPSSLSLTIP
ncbi:MAG: hypothetical protein QOH00_3333 [Gaiellales bacterium]|nr:hypothetical protein [Gaiellales bacterium]